MHRHLQDRDRKNNYTILAESSYLDGNKEKAIEFYNKSLQFEGDRDEDIGILYDLAIIYDELDIPLKALRTYRRIIQLDSGQAGAYYGMATMHERLGEDERALEYYFKAVGIDPEYDRAYFYIANIYDEMGNEEKAIHYYGKVIDIKPDDHIAYNNLGSIYEEMGDYSRAYNMISRSIELEPNYYKALFNMGVIYKRLGNNEKAMEYYDRSLENEKYSDSYLNKSAIYIEEDRLEECVEVLTEGIRYNPYAEYLYYNRACCYSRLNMVDSAIEDLRKSILIYPGILDMAADDEDFNNIRKDQRFLALFNRDEAFD